MNRICVLLGAAVLAANLYGNDFFNALTNLAYAVARTNVCLVANRQSSASSNDFVGAFLRSSVESDFNATGTVTNTLRRLWGTGTTAATTAATTTNAATAAMTTATSANAACTSTVRRAVYRYPQRPMRPQPINRRPSRPKRATGW